MSNNNIIIMQSKFDMTTQLADEKAALKLGLSQSAQTANMQTLLNKSLQVARSQL